jgi:hypothetical protein
MVRIRVSIDDLIMDRYWRLPLEARDLLTGLGYGREDLLERGVNPDGPDD